MGKLILLQKLCQSNLKEYTPKLFLPAGISGGDVKTYLHSKRLCRICIPESVLKPHWNIYTCCRGSYLAFQNIPELATDIKELLILSYQ